MNNAIEYRAEIHTGQFETASPEDRDLVQYLLGENTDEKFELYFHWYNVVHEIGHAVMDFNCESRPHPVEEEQLVNDFAVAFWRMYGEKGKLEAVHAIIEDALQRFRVPAKGMTHMEFARAKWGTDELHNFNNYGWFQYNCVRQSFESNSMLGETLTKMGIAHVCPQESRGLKYCVDERLPHNVVRDVVQVLRDWRISLPERFDVVLRDDPNCHMLQTIKLNNFCKG